MIEESNVRKFVRYDDPHDPNIHHRFRQSMSGEERQLWLSDLEEALAQLLVDGWIDTQKGTSTGENEHGGK
jgi:hypothetical protein